MDPISPMGPKELHASSLGTVTTHTGPSNCHVLRLTIKIATYHSVNKNWYDESQTSNRGPPISFEMTDDLLDVRHP
ncbi:hypothetical protein T265_10442 [Opisthorchis viverrini]|uniref:Uncharacterized protein n=1 Tax=Opisthorchis viverrini TaxID=6198 RepID=A0A074Z2B6_OPIVI|nr:hypothetical protein T265_10442 [Opisthorchis viverrini]KER21166.1 hypothetical protein T265_10442 [Opisthorchis viverrini]